MMKALGKSGTAKDCACTMFLTAAVLVFCPSCSDKVTIGAAEDVVILPWAIHLTARIDTGAHTSSLYVKDVVETNGIVAFRFPETLGGKRAQLPLAEWVTIKSSDGIEDKRPEVFVNIRLANRTIHTRVTLDDRSRMAYPMLIGRRTLKGRFVVDVGKGKPGVTEPEGGPE